MWGHDYGVKTVRDPHYLGEAVMGLFKPNEMEIVLSKKWLDKKPTREAEVLLHEIMHGIAHNSQMFGNMTDVKEPGKLEEHVVSVMANGLVAVLVDNPELTDYLKERTTNAET